MTNGAHGDRPPGGAPRSPGPPLTDDLGGTAPSVPELTDASIPTDASLRTLRLLVEHLDAQPVTGGAAAAGDIVSVSGRVGTGKTHLAGLLIERCSTHSSRTDRPVRPVYLDLAFVAAESFYTRFVEALPQREVTACVLEYHTDLVGRQIITDKKLGGRVVEILRSTSLTPRQREEYIDRFGLSEATLLVQLQDMLDRIVEEPHYAAAFTFLLREGLDQAAWSWLRGNPPAEILVERGFGDARTRDFTHLAPFARLYERQQYRLVLILDNLDQLRFASDPDRQMRAFGKMIDRLREAGVLVFLLSAHDLSDRLGLGRAGRVGVHIEMPLWDTAATVGRYLSVGSPDGGLRPFHPDAAALIADLTGGRPAAISGFSARLRSVAQRTGENVSAAVVSREARNYFATIDRAGLVAAVSRVLEGRSWYFRTDQEIPVRDGPPVPVDFWIPSDGPVQAGCALVIVDALVNAADVARLTAVAEALDRAEARNEALVLVTGVLSGEHADQVGDRFRREPLRYSAESFDVDLETAVKAMRHDLATSTAGGVLAGISDRVTAIDRQQARMFDLVRNVLSAVDELRTETTAPGERRGPAVERAPDPVAALPPDTLAVFTGARRAVEDLGGLSAVGSGLFAADATRVAPDSALRRLTDPDSGLMTAVGAASAVLTVLDAFRSALENWFRRSATAVSTSVEDTDPELNRLCDRYAELVLALPLDELRDLEKLPPPHRSLPPWAERYDNARKAIQRLADGVRAALAG